MDRSSRTDETSPAHRITRFMHRWPDAIRLMITSQTAAFSGSSQLREAPASLGWSESAARTVIAEVEDVLRRGLTPRPSAEALSAEDLQLAESIADETRQAGISNITRTAAYLACYEACPELHWAFLAHMVSRNAGYNMTDLQGSRLEEAMEPEAKRLNYRFLERSNALIFQDAYPQLLLYRKSRERGASLFHLLPYFHVSRFMSPFWERFWIDRGSALLTVGLIINEQNYVEKRVIQHPYFQKYVTGTAGFHLFSLMGLNQIVFPLLEPAEGMDASSALLAEERAASSEAPLAADAASGAERDAEEEGAACTNAPPGKPAADWKVRRLAGRTVSDFGSLAARIALGKSLYAMLMGYRAVRSGAERFAASVPHSGSRADYWPDLFTANLEEALTTPTQASALLDMETLPPGERLYSPKLLSVWGDTPYEPISREDWLKDLRALDGISAPKRPFLCDISRKHRNGLLKTALVHDAVDER